MGNKGNATRRRDFFKGALIVAGLGILVAFKEKLRSFIPKSTAPEKQAENTIDPVFSEVARQSALTDLRYNENSMGASPLAMSEAMYMPNLENRYALQDYYLVGLKKAISKESGVGEENIFLAPGSLSIILRFLERFKTRRLVISDPDFYKVFLLAERLGIRICKVPILKESYTIDLNTLAKEAHNQKSVVYLSNPHLPFGGHQTFDQLENFLSKISSDVPVLVDEAYIHYVSDIDDIHQVARLVEKYENLMVIRTFSKIYGLAALRIGSAFRNHRSSIYAHFWEDEDERMVSSVAAASAIAAISDKDQISVSQFHVTKMREVIKHFAKNNGLKLVGDHGNYVSFLFDNSTRHLREDLFKRGFVFDRGIDLTHLRVTLGEATRVNQFIQTLPELLKPI